MTQAVPGSGFSAHCLHIKAIVFPKTAASRMSPFHQAGCGLWQAGILWLHCAGPWHCSSTGHLWVLSVVFILLLEALQDKPFAVCSLLVLSGQPPEWLWLPRQCFWSPASTNPRGLVQTAAGTTGAGPVGSQLPAHLLLALQKNMSRFAHDQNNLRCFPYLYFPPLSIIL